MNTSGLQKVISNSFITKRRISSGSFGVVYQGYDLNTKEVVAIKIDKGGKEDTSLEREAEILRRLGKVAQIPRLRWAGKEAESNVIVIQYLGRDLTHFLKTFRKFSLKCVLNIAEQMLNIIESMHKNSVIHRDIKPENVLVGRDDEEHLLYIVDFGISKFFKDENNSHISYREKQPFIGTTRYASVNAHRGISLSRRDDLESLGYMLIFLLKGQLPWQNLVFTNEEEKIKLVGEMKAKMDTSEICKGIPKEFTRFLDYVKGLPFKAEPNYKYCSSLFRKVQHDQGYQMRDLAFDWVNIKKEDMNQSSTNCVNSRPSILKKSKEEINSNNYIQNQQQSIDSDMNSLLKTPEQLNRKKNRLQSISSYNDSISDIDFNNSILIGIQPSALSRLSKISFNSNSKGGNSRLNIMMNNKIESNFSASPEQKSNKIYGLERRKSALSQFYRNKETDEILECSKMNELDEGIEIKYSHLKEKFINARFKFFLNHSLKETK